MSDEHVELGNAGTGLEQARHLLSCAEEEVIAADITIPLLRSITHAAIATAEAARETRDLLRAILAELQAQRLESCIEHVGDAKAIDPDLLAAALGICPCCLEREVERDGRCVQCAGQEYIPGAEDEPQAQRPATAEWDPATVAGGGGLRDGRRETNPKDD